MKKIIFIIIAGILSNFVNGQNKMKSDDIISQISSAETVIKIENHTIIDELNFANVENIIEGKPSKSTTIIKKNKRHSDTIVRYSQKNRVQINVDLEFESCVFEGEIDAKNKFRSESLATRIIAQFNGNLTFKDCLFKENVDFSSVEFEGDLKFINCTFKMPFSLSGIRSNKNFIFENCTFDSMCHFNNMLISRKAILDHCNFNHDFSLFSTVFSVEPDITSSKFQNIKLRNCLVVDQPFFWYFEDDKKYETLLSKVKYDKTFYGTKFKHHKAITIYTSRSNWKGKDTAKRILKLWDARAEIKTEEGKYKVWGRIIWDKNQHILIVDRAKLKAPNGDILSESKKLEIDLDNPSQFKIL